MNPRNRIHDYLKENGISQQYLSRKTGISPSKLNLSLNNKRKLSVDEFEAICNVLAVSADTFIKPLAPKKGGSNENSNC